MCGQDEDFSEH